ncbi:baseplate megatron protein TIM-barrel domain-containing protein [Rickettsia endosymbiont of Halotydeus destructor]|uniref:baseplate megatron protein TIM-barrel domain-containing protein n=1 Tax=Rickettsia endosymbiont of Halotydeus destructor TaxID=2996754 RepID=UPI003BB124E1
MLGKIFGSLGGALGKSIGGGIFSTIGRFAGKTFGDYLDQLNHKPEEYHQYKNIRESFHLSTAHYGEPIPLIFGLARVNGKIIWAKQIKQIENTTSSKEYFPYFHQIRTTHSLTEYKYYLSFAISICEGEIAEITRVWANDELINLGKYKFRLYLGSETQTPDPLIENSCGIGKTPAFRSLSYLVFEDLPLEDFNDSIPNFSFEVTRKPNIPIAANHVITENLISAINMIPGSGEYVYDTIVQYKTIESSYGSFINRAPINSHNYLNIANSIFSLNQLQTTCPNIKWVAPVVSWFADNLNTELCSIKPAIEFNDSYTKYSAEWQVSHYTRKTAKIISKDNNNNPNYGGSINDASLLRYLQELKKRNLKIMFYPMFFMDVPGKPWRGYVTGASDSIHQFFNKADGYNNFILHYARLVKDYADAFIIGSELIGITSIKDSADNFPGVNELIRLAKLVKEIVGVRVLVTYAADWSEYHHTNGGWYNLDPLFASPDIDFVGIDAYFPLTRTLNSQITRDEIIKGCQSGEGYDYYLDYERQQQSLSAAYAWKNLRYWWENHHYNPNGLVTTWQPKMKKIWFTEFGFPSIDKAPNQPNVFFDPFCQDGGVPKYSSGATDFTVQRSAIKAFLEYWQEEEYIEEMFLWTWDARPYPAWPHGNIWSDNHLWEKGHWVNGKFGVCSLAAIILELSNKCGIALHKVDISTIDETIEGLVLNKALSTIDIINSLRIFYFFDILANNHKQIKFIKRGYGDSHNLDQGALVKLSDNSYLKQTEIPKENIISKITINFIDRFNNYQNCYCYINNENSSNNPPLAIKIPVILSLADVERVGQLILKNAALESKIIKFVIFSIFHGYKPGDFVILNYFSYRYQIRIVSIELSNLTSLITGIIDEAGAYYLPTTGTSNIIESTSLEETKCTLLDLPFNVVNTNDKPYLAVYLQSNINQFLYVSDSNDNYVKIANLTKRTYIGYVVKFENATNINVSETDTISKIVVSCKNFEDLVKNDWNLAIWGSEIIKFQKWQKLDINTYQIQEIMRGNFSTQQFISSHGNNEHFIILEHSPNIIPVSSKLENKEIYFKVGDLKAQKIKFQNRAKIG